MPTMIDTPERIAPVETPALLAERPQIRGVHLGFWCTLAHGITEHLPHRSHERQAPAYRVRRPFETPMDRLAREYPSLSLSALSMI